MTKEDGKGADQSDRVEDSSDSWRDIAGSTRAKGKDGDSDTDSAIFSPNKTIPEMRPWSSDSQNPDAETTKRSGKKIKGGRFLILGDDPARIDAFAQSLRQLGATVAVGDRVESGFDQAAQFMPDAIISDLASPGERGWGLVQRFRRHPILRWTPVLLLKWWEESPSGERRILIDRVQDRLEETLSPIGQIQDRIVEGRPLSERMDMTGPPALLRMLEASALSGLLTVNDAWSVFEIRLNSGGLHSVTRRGVDGGTDQGDAAFLQLLFCDTGRWSFRVLKEMDVPSNIGSELDQALRKAGQIVNALFTPSAELNRRMSRHLRVFVDRVAAIAASISISAQLVAENISEGRVSSEMDGLLDNEDGLFEVDRALRILIRCGAIRPQKEPIEEEREMAERRAVESVIYLLMAVVEGRSFEDGEHASAVSNKKAAVQRAVERTAGSPKDGGYHISEVKPERVAQINSAQIKLPVDATKTEGELGHALPSAEGDTPSTTGVVPPDRGAMGGVSQNSEGTTGSLSYAKRLLRGLVHDSLVPSPASPIRPQNWGSVQMWLAIAMAAIILGILIAGLVYIGTGTREDDIDDLPLMEGSRENE
ncbi:MAG: response regulator [Proteobacteria bacterium]|nr:response regulator [Pseudomonadota bacterium]